MTETVTRLLEKRIASRSISPQPLEEAVVAALIEASRLTPSCFNNQPWRFLFLEGQDALSKGRKALNPGNRQWASRAPLLVMLAIGGPSDETDHLPDYAKEAAQKPRERKPAEEIVKRLS
jgi:nitroreductase